MRIILDTNVVISGLFFGGYPGKILLSVLNDSFDAFASEEIVCQLLGD